MRIASSRPAADLDCDAPTGRAQRMAAGRARDARRLHHGRQLAGVRLHHLQERVLRAEGARVAALMSLPDKTREQFVVALAIHPDEQRDLAHPGRARLDADRSGAGVGYPGPLSGVRAGLERRDRRGQERLRRGRAAAGSAIAASVISHPAAPSWHRKPASAGSSRPARVCSRSRRRTRRARGSTPSSATMRAIRVPLARSPRSISTHRACCRSCSSASGWTDEHRHAGFRASGRRGRRRPPPRVELRAALEALFSRAASPRIVDLDTRPLPYASSFAIEEATVRFDDGSILELVCKDTGEAAMLPEARRIKPRFLHNPLREIATYERILAPFDVGAPRFYGSAIDERRGRYWLFLERVRGVPLTEVGDFGVWRQVSGWLAWMHGRVARDPGLAARRRCRAARAVRPGARASLDGAGATVPGR